MVQRDSKVETQAAFAVNLSRTGYASERPTSKHCVKTGHEQSNCFELIGYPAGWAARGGGYERGRGRSRGGRGGRGPAGRGRGSNTAYAAHTNADEQPTAEPQSSRPIIPSLSVEQVQQLLTLIEVPKIGGDTLSGNGLWLLDSGASCHMTGNLNKLSKVCDICPILVNMSNGQRSIASKQGMVRFNNNII